MSFSSFSKEPKQYAKQDNVRLYVIGQVLERPANKLGS